MICFIMFLKMFMTLALHVNTNINQSISTGQSSGKWCTSERWSPSVSKISPRFYPFKFYPDDYEVRRLNLLLSHDAGSEPDLGSVQDGTNYDGNHGAVTQEVDLAKQYEAGVRIFDIRVAKDKKGDWRLFHEWFGGNKFFGKAEDELLRLQDAAIEAADICIVKFKGKDDDFTVKLQNQLIDEMIEMTQEWGEDGQLYENQECLSGRDYIRAKAERGDPLPYYDSDSNIGQMRCHCVLLRDTDDFHLMKAKKIEEGQHRKVFDLAGDGVINSIYEKFKKHCTQGKTLRLGMTSTGISTSPLCRAYENSLYIQEIAEQILTIADAGECNVFLGLDGSYGVITGKHCQQLGCSHE